jgi:hypothetical protein
VVLNELKVTLNNGKYLLTKFTGYTIDSSRAYSSCSASNAKNWQINLPENTINDLNLRLPELPQIDEQDFYKVRCFIN